MAPPRKFYRYIITVDILSADPSYDPQELTEVVRSIDNDAVDGQWDITGRVELTAKEMVTLLLARGSDPERFHLDDAGHELGGEPAPTPTVQPTTPIVPPLKPREQRELS